MNISRDSVHPGETEGCWNPRPPLKIPPHKLSLPGTHLRLRRRRDSGSRGAWEVEAEAELCGFGVRAGGVAAIVPVQSLPPARTAKPGLQQPCGTPPLHPEYLHTTWDPALPKLRTAWGSFGSIKPGPALQSFFKNMQGILSNSGGVRHVQGETQLCGFRARPGGTWAIVLGLSSAPTQPNLH